MIRDLAQVAAFVSIALAPIGCGGPTSQSPRPLQEVSDCASPNLDVIPVIVGPMSTAGNTYQATLTFGDGYTSKTDPVYSDVRRALGSFLADLSKVGASGEITERTNGDDVTSISVVVRGPLLKADNEMVDKAFNTLACNARLAKGSKK